MKPSGTSCRGCWLQEPSGPIFSCRTRSITSSVARKVSPATSTIFAITLCWPALPPVRLRSDLRLLKILQKPSTCCRGLIAECNQVKSEWRQPESFLRPVDLSCGRRELQRQRAPRRVLPRCRWSKNCNQLTRALLRFVTYFER